MVHSSTLIVVFVLVVYSFVRRLFQLKFVIEGVASATFIQRLVDFVDAYSAIHFGDVDDK